MLNTFLSNPFLGGEKGGLHCTILTWDGVVGERVFKTFLLQFGLTARLRANFFLKAFAIIDCWSLTLQGNGICRSGVPPGDLQMILKRKKSSLCRVSCF